MNGDYSAGRLCSSSCRKELWKQTKSAIFNWINYILLLQSNQVERTPQDYINELVIWILNSLVISVNNPFYIEFINISPISRILGMTSGFNIQIIN